MTVVAYYITQVPPYLETKLILTIMCFSSKLMPISALVLYCIIAWLVSLFYATIEVDVNRKKIVRKETILMWKRGLVLVRELVERINTCFGLILLVLITHFFIDLIIQSFYLGSSIHLNNWIDMLIAIAHTLMKFCCLWFVAYNSSEMHRNVLLS